jgi:nucleotide-binding universal stress UspA family protein
MAGFPATESPMPAVPSTARSGALRPRRARIQNILLATDLSPISDSAAAEAIDLCGALGARLLIVNVIDSRQGFGKQLMTTTRASRIDQIRADRERSLLEVVGQARASGIDASFLVWIGEPGQSIVSAAEAEGADLLVVGTRALDRAGRFLLGSVSDYVVNNSPCPVLIAR